MDILTLSVVYMLLLIVIIIVFNNIINRQIDKVGDSENNIMDYFDKQDNLKMKFHRLYNRDITGADLLRARENVEFESKNHLIQWLIDDFYKQEV